MNQQELNIRIEKFIKDKDSRKEDYSLADKTFIAQYEGAGGLSSKGATGQGILHEFYTPEWLCKKMWQLAHHYGFDGGTILEPSCGTGRFLKDAPSGSSVTAFEINPISARITEILYPKATVYNQYFETAFLATPRFTSLVSKGNTWLKNAPFSLVISNPPYGKHVNQYSSFFKKDHFKQLETFFIYKSLQLLKPGGLLVFVTSSNIMSSGISYQGEKDRIGELAELVDAYRLPPVFKNTQISTDIIILRKKNG